MDEQNNELMFVYYGIYGNHSKPQPLTEVYVDRILNKHGDAGMAIISANKTDIDPNSANNSGRINNANTKQLIRDIQKTGRSFIPVYGGYHNPSNNVVDSYEPSFVVTNYDREGNEMDFDDLFRFAVAMCGKYDQDSVLIKGKGNVPPHYYNRNGDIVSDKEKDTNNAIKNDITQEYFTSLIKTNNLDKEHPERSKRFTYDIHFPDYGDDEKDKEKGKFECFVNPNPASLNERMRRDKGGEILFC